MVRSSNKALLQESSAQLFLMAFHYVQTFMRAVYTKPKWMRSAQFFVVSAIMLYKFS
jgi:hypothetical protein